MMKSEVKNPSVPATQVYAWFVVGVLSLASIVSYVDRQIINLLVEPIKADLGINDTQIGLLQGFSFALFYAILALPLARLSDGGNRVRIISLGIVCWSAATFFCGLATTFMMLFFARMFVGVGEATLAPSGYSILSDYFPKERAALAISIFTGSGFVGSGLAYLLGGVIISALDEMGSISLPVVGVLAPWQMAFLAVSLPGVLLFFLVRFVREPERREATDASEKSDSSFRSVVAHIRANQRLFAGVFFGLTLMAAGAYAVNMWTPTYFIRVHGWTPLQVGSVFGLLVVVASSLGVFSGGAIASFLMKRGMAGANLIVPCVAAGFAIPFVVAFPLAPTPTLSFIFLAPALFFSAVPFGCGTAVLPLISPNRIRAQIVAIYLLIANLLGFTLGPTSIGFLTDFVFASPELVGYSLATAPAALYGLGLLLVFWATPKYAALIRRST